MEPTTEPLQSSSLGKVVSSFIAGVFVGKFMENVRHNRLHTEIIKQQNAKDKAEEIAAYDKWKGRER